MKKLSDFKDEKAFEVIGDLLTPIYNMLSNEENRKLQDKSFLEMIQGFLKNTPKEMMKLFAILEEVPIEDYHCNALTVTKNVMTLADDEQLAELFTSQGQKGDAKSSVSASVTTEE